MDLSVVCFLAAVVSGAGGVRQLRRFHERLPVVEPVPGTETWTVEEIEALRQGSKAVGIRFRRQVGIIAAAGPGPDGLLTSPDGKARCVWWRNETRRRYVAESVTGERVVRSEQIRQNSSSAPFTLTDDTGTLLVQPEGAVVTGARKVFSRTENHEFEAVESQLNMLLGLDSTIAIVVIEYALLPGARVFVHGEAHDRNTTTLTIGAPYAGGPFVISTKRERSLRLRAKQTNASAETTRWQGYLLISLAVTLTLAAIFVV